MSCCVRSRSISVRAIGVPSQPFRVSASIPRGSTLVLTVLFINDLLPIFDRLHRFFHYVISIVLFPMVLLAKRNVNFSQDHTVLSESLASGISQISVWSFTNHVSFNASKASLLFHYSVLPTQIFVHSTESLPLLGFSINCANTVFSSCAQSWFVIPHPPFTQSLIPPEI